VDPDAAYFLAVAQCDLGLAELDPDAAYALGVTQCDLGLAELDPDAAYVLELTQCDLGLAELDPDLAYVVPEMGITRNIVAGSCFDIPVQSVVFGALADAIFTEADTLTGYVYQGRSAAPLFQPAIAWYTAPGPSGTPTQTGYQQGQVLVSGTNAQGALLGPTGSYTLVVDWSPAANPSKTAPIVRMKLPVEARTAF
jgi:hypothetical protein